jgi:hypothetical protein
MCFYSIVQIVTQTFTEFFKLATRNLIQRCLINASKQDQFKENE